MAKSHNFRCYQTIDISVRMGSHIVLNHLFNYDSLIKPQLLTLCYIFVINYDCHIAMTEYIAHNQYQIN